MERKHVILSGHGRSGTNLALQYLDFHEATFCRNEPDALVSDRFEHLQGGLEEKPRGAAFLRDWNAFVHEAAGQNGERDHFLDVEKDYHRSALAVGIWHGLYRRRHFRRMLSLVRPDFAADVWNVPASYIDTDVLRGGLPVLKILLSSGWLARSHDDSLGQHVVHIRREPADFLVSWFNRYVCAAEGGPEAVFADSWRTLPMVLERFDQDPARLRRFSLENLFETEMWRWRYGNAVLENAIGASGRYMQISYDDLQGDGQSSAERLFTFAGLPFRAEHAERVSKIRNRIFTDAHSQTVDPAMLSRVIERVMRPAFSPRTRRAEG